MKIPVVGLRGMTILPHMAIHFDISRKKSATAIEKAMLMNQKVFVTAQKEAKTAEPGYDDLYVTGTVAEIKQIVRMPNKILRIMVTGAKRARLTGLEDEKEYLSGNIEECDIGYDIEDDIMEKAMVEGVHDAIRAYGAANPKFSSELLNQFLEIRKIEQLIDTVAINFPMFYTEKQEYLECDTVTERYTWLLAYLENQTEICKIRGELAAKVKEKVDKNQREYVLHEQLKVIHEELGDTEDIDEEIEGFEKAVKKLKASKAVKEKLTKEIKRYKNISASSSEAAVTRTYIETLLEMPWDKASKDNTDIVNAEKILNDEHYGLDKVKERIIEFLAVRALTRKGDTPIVCLVGPPGTGKTSIAMSVAHALDKKYERISLGGIRDEAEIRGHRKTYVGAMPGRIATAIKNAGVKNPLILLDEIDKVSNDNYRGDTASALLEVLDGNQNDKFRDHYIELPIDLSEVLFIATANDISGISKPLRDRMEIIEVSSYTENEKFHIAKDHLVSKQVEKNGLTAKEITFSDKALKKIIESYTKESGVRGLERQIASVCRKAAKQILSKECKKVKVTDKNLEEYLGKEKYTKDMKNEENDIGIVRGLAWTSVGGDTLSVEVNVMPGKGVLKTTGQLGDVMKESAETALSYIRSIACEYGVAEDYFEKKDIHIHVPEGAVPKDVHQQVLPWQRLCYLQYQNGMCAVM